MAERANATSKKTQDAAQDVSTLQKRGRRRLVGAIALVLVAVIVLPMVFDPEPKPTAPLVSVRIPSEDSTKFTPRSTLKPPEPESRPAEKKAEEAPAAPAPAPSAARAPVTATEPVQAASEPAKPVEKPAAKAAEKPAAKPAAKAVEKPVPKAAEKPAEKAAPAPPAGEQYMVQVGAFASPDKVKEITAQLAEAKLPHYTESVATAKGAVTRVRMGPFPTKEAAEKARERARALGLNPANPVVK